MRVGPEIGKGTLKGRQKMVGYDEGDGIWRFRSCYGGGELLSISNNDWGKLGLKNYNAALAELNGQLVRFETDYHNAIHELKKVTEFPDDEYSSPPLLPWFRGKDIFHEGDLIYCLIRDTNCHYVWYETKVLGVWDNVIWPESRRVYNIYPFNSITILTLYEYQWYCKDSKYRDFLKDHSKNDVFKQALLAFDNIDV